MRLREALSRTAAAPRLALAAATALVAFALVPAASSASAFRPCPGSPEVQCASVVVPFDPSGAVRGSFALHVERMHTRGAARGAVIALAGGPGQAATPFLPDFRLALDPALDGRDLVVFDQRGTGLSNELFCRGLGSHRSPDLGVGSCASQLGSIRGYFSTSDSVSDIEAVRQAIGVDRIELYGVSYGTKVALDYATRYPQHVDKLVLDSVVMPGALDPYDLASFAAVPRILRQVCERGACSGISSDPVADLGRLVSALSTREQHGVVVGSRGKPRRAAVRRSGVLSVLFEGDFDPVLRADFPAAVKAALQGDATPILRLIAATRGAENLSGPDSNALNMATSCEDAALPWDPAAPRAQRLSQAQASFAQISPATYAPFDGATVFRESLAPFCASWPEAGPNPPVETNPLPGVPTLVLSGNDDLRTPQEDAAKLVSELPDATLVRVPATGHSVLGSDLFGCSTRALRQFFRGETVSACPNHRELLPPSPVPPRSLSRLPRLAGLPAQAGRTLLAARLTLADTFEHAVDSAVFASTSAGAIPPVGGLRGGYLTVTPRAIELHAYSWIPGVTLSGRVPFRGTSKIRIGGRAAAHGTLTISEHGVVHGRLGGHHVGGRFGASAASASALTAHAPAWDVELRRFAPFARDIVLPG